MHARSSRVARACSAWPLLIAMTSHCGYAPSSAKSPIRSSTLCRTASSGQRSGCSGPSGPKTTALSSVPPCASPRARSASTSCKKPKVRAPANLLAIGLRRDRRVEVLRADRGGIIADEAHAERVGRQHDDQPVAVAEDHALRARAKTARRAGANSTQAERLDRFGERLAALPSARESRGRRRDLGVAHAHGKERREQVFDRRDAGAVAAEHRRSGDVSTRSPRSPERARRSSSEDEAVTRVRRANSNAAGRTRMQDRRPRNASGVASVGFRRSTLIAASRARRTAVFEQTAGSLRKQ